MKTKVITLFFLLIPFLKFSQSIDNLKVQTQKYYDAHYTMDFDEIVNLTYPKIVQTIIKEVMTDKLDSDYQNNEFRKRLQLEKPEFQYSTAKKIESRTFCIISFRNPTRYFYEHKLDASAGAKEAIALKSKTKAFEVIFEPKRNSFNVRRISKLIAVSDDLTQNQWKFIDPDDSGQMAVFETMISTEEKVALGF